MKLRTLTAILIGLCLAVATAQAQNAQPGGTAKNDAKTKTIIILVDYSGSMAALEDTNEPFTCHLLKLAELSGEPVAFTVIFFGGDGVQVFPAKGGPTTGHKSLHHDLAKNWPRPKGETPLDAAMQEAVRIVGSLPRGSDVSVILLTDGEPDSGYLRPEAFPEVKAEIDRMVKAIQAKGYPPAITQQLLARFEKETQDPPTEVFKRLYLIQCKAEFNKTLDHAKALKQAKVRLVSVDYVGGIAALKQIHDAAGGKENDLVVVHPASTVIAKLHKLGLTAMPRVVVQDPVFLPEDSKAYERSIPLKFDPIGDRALVTLVFEKPVADFGKHLLLEVSFDGNTYSFSEKNEEPARILSFDGAGKVATAHLVLDRLPADRQVTVTLKSPSLSMTMPALSVYAHLRVGKDIVAQFRPHHAPADAAGPFRISPNQEVRWIAAFRSKENSKPYAMKSIEAIFKNVHTGEEFRLETHLDPQVAFTFASEPARVPRGTYDVTLQTVLESGASITTLLPRHVQSELAEECIALEITQKTNKDAEYFSFQPGHVDFGEIGDDRTGGKVAVIVRSMGVPFDIPVEVSVESLVDSQGKSPKVPWIIPDRKNILLKPGRPEVVFLSVNVPKEIEEELSDGLFKGQLSFVRKDLGEPMPVKRFQSIAGVPDDEPPDLISFTLRRPKLEVRAPRCLRNSLRTDKDNRVVLPIRETIAKPFARTVTLTVLHTSVVARQVTVLTEATFVDTDGRQIPFVRLVPVDPDKHTCEVGPGQSAQWTFRFEADESFDLRKATGRMVVSGPGLPTTHITVEILPRASLLGRTWQLSLWILGVVMVILMLLALIRFWRAWKFREGNEVAVTEARPLAGFFQIKATGKNQITLQPQRPIMYGYGDEPKKRLSENGPLTVKSDSLSPSKPLVIEERTSDGSEGWIITLHEIFFDPAEIRGEITSAPAQFAEASRNWRQVRRWFLLAIGSMLAAAMFFTPSVVCVAQWIYDFFCF